MKQTTLTRTEIIACSFNAVSSASFSLHSVDFEPDEMIIKQVSLVDSNYASADRITNIDLSFYPTSIFSYPRSTSIIASPDSSYKLNKAIRGEYKMTLSTYNNNTIANIATINAEISLIVEFIKYL
jgi:hypothetical protein